MNPTSPDSRLEDMEVKIAFLENALSQLDEVVRELADDNVRLKREVAELRERMQAAMGAGEAMDPERYQVPPHY
ncbi:MAG: SlyX protein [Deltaproteobacteria bacterium]|nr:SlyX protein [Deltaproteobacteria bacterium]HCH62992.1 SlyX protein [Deltaproteobacteria bacterium]